MVEGRFLTHWTQLFKQQESTEKKRKKSTQVETVNGIKILLTHWQRCRPAECEISMMQLPSEYNTTGKIAQNS